MFILFRNFYRQGLSLACYGIIVAAYYAIVQNAFVLTYISKHFCSLCFNVRGLFDKYEYLTFANKGLNNTLLEYERENHLDHVTSRRRSY